MKERDTQQYFVFKNGMLLLSSIVGLVQTPDRGGDSCELTLIGGNVMWKSRGYEETRAALVEYWEGRL